MDLDEAYIALPPGEANLLSILQRKDCDAARVLYVRPSTRPEQPATVS